MKKNIREERKEKLRKKRGEEGTNLAFPAGEKGRREENINFLFLYCS
jgi:hypothetical protein